MGRRRRRQALVLASTVAMLAVVARLPAVAAGDDLDALLDGVADVAAPGVPGPLCVYGPHVFPVVVGATNGLRAPVVAAGRWEAGRVVVLGHDGYLDAPKLEHADTGRLLTNALNWTAAAGGRGDARIGVVTDRRTAGLRAWLTDAGYDAVEVAPTPESLGAVDVVAVVMWDQSEPEIEALSSFVRAGGGLVAAATAWAWVPYLHPDLDIVEDYPGNRLLAPSGIQWTDEYLDRTSPGGYAVDRQPPALTHAGRALDAVEAHAEGEHALTPAESEQAVDSLVRAVGCLPPGDTLLAPRLQALVENNDHWPSAARPVGKTDVLARIAAKVFVAVHQRTPPGSVRAHPAAVDFPGSVPADAPRVTRSLTIDTDVPRWHSTGLYAAPGELVTVTLPAAAAEAGGFHVRIGTHSDDISRRPEWERMPEISRRFRVSAATTPAANAFGGLIYVEVPADAGLGDVTVRIEGAVVAPRFVLGETTPAAWLSRVRLAPAPWAEIEGRNMIVTTAAREVRGLDDPTAVAQTWDRVLDLSAELAAWPARARSSPERFVVDREISAGYMHAGYPLMAKMDQSANLVDAPHISTCRYDRTQSNWGFFHEVGHNHQSRDWTFDGTGEVTVNLFTLYVYEFLCGIPVAENWRGSAEFRAEQMALYDFDDPDFELWKREPFLALVMYVQMQQAFGWDAYRRVFATYRALPDVERPKNDDEKRDQWLVRFSRQVGRNLGPFFEAWGVPISRAARDSIADLPGWLPAELPVDANLPPVWVGALAPLRIRGDEPAVTVDVAGAFRDPDGDVLAYGATSSAPGVAAVSVSGSVVAVRPASEGTARVTVTAIDPGGLEARQSFVVTVWARRPFTDDPIVPGITPVRAVHFTELRARIDPLRQAAGLARFAWTDPVLTARVTRVRRVHLLELRSALAEAYAAAGRRPPGWTDAAPAAGSTAIRAAHLTELRAAVRALE